MKLLHILTIILCCLLASSCNGQKREGSSTEVVLETTLGDIRIALFDDTPGHRDNFIANVKAGLYDGVTFHRIIRNFMIQTGDPDTRPGMVRDTTKAVERIPAEFVFPKYYHQRGFVGAARDGDDENPERMSDKHQFYIITGKICKEGDMLDYERARADRETQVLYDKLCAEHKSEIDAVRRQHDPYKLSDLLEKYQDEAEDIISRNPPLTYTKEQRRTYGTKGGAPWLDGEYTIFGEVIEGMAVVEKIQKIKTSEDERPLQPVTINRAYIKEK